MQNLTNKDKALEGGAYSTNATGDFMQRTSPIFIALILLLSVTPLNFASASGEATSFNTFSGGFATVDVTLQGNTMNNSTTIDVPRNVTFTTSSFEISVDSTEDSPGQVWIDINEDGIFEWEFSATGYGNIGHQNQFYDGSAWYNSPVASGNSSVPGILIPSSSTLQSSALDVSFSPSASGGFFAIGEYQEVIETDIDGDGNPEPMFLSKIQSNNTTTITWADWDPNTGISTLTPIQTCDNATSISVADINGDGDHDIVAFSKNAGKACIHMANGTSFAPLQNSTVIGGLVSAKLGDIDSDGSAEVISINTEGNIGFQSWNNSTSGLSSIVTQRVDSNISSGISMGANLLTLHVEDFFGNGTVSALVMDDTGHWSLWQYFSGIWGGPITEFDDISRDEVLIDFDSDGDIDLFGANDEGYAFRINDGTKWDLNPSQNQIYMTNSTISDFDNDGVLDLMTPIPGFSDGNSSTVEGNISLRTINSSHVGEPMMLELQPWSIPTSILTMDMDGDGVLEHVVSAGESNLGVFIGGWHSIELDADGDGTPEMNREGYAGDSNNGLAPLFMTDDANSIREDLSMIKSSLPTVTDSYGISMVNFTMGVKSSGDGEFNYSNMDIGYDCVFLVNQNPHVMANLSNSFNQQMTGGIGNLTIEIPVNSTKAGEISLTNIFAMMIPGAPNLSIPITPVVTLVNATTQEILVTWNDSVEFGEDFIEFEIFRLESQNETIDLNNVYNRTFLNELRDTDVSVGSTYWYVVRSTHSFGIASNLSNILQVTVPYPEPPAAVSGLSLTDIGGDFGGALQLSWNHSIDTFSFYEIYLESQQFTSISGLNPLQNVSSDNNTTIFSGLLDGQEYWASVVAVDQYGNKTTAVVSVGPAYPRNDQPSLVDLQLSVSPETALGSPFNLEVTARIDGNQVIPQGDITISMQTSSGTYPISTNWDSINLTDFTNLVSNASYISGDVTFWANYSGYSGDAQNRPIAATSTSASSIVKVGATFTASENTYELDWDNETSVRVNLTALYPSQQVMLEGSTFTWTAFNNTTGTSNSGTHLIENGFKQFIVSFSEEGILFINLTSPDWIDYGDNTLQIPLVLYGNLVDDNSSEQNNTDPVEWSPTFMLDVTLNCGSIVLDIGSDELIECTIFNPNNYSVDVSLEPDGWSDWTQYIEFNPLPGQNQFTLSENGSIVIEISETVSIEFDDSGLTEGLLQIDLRQSPTNYSSPAARPMTIEFQWELKEEVQVIEPTPIDDDNNKTTETKDDSSSDNTMLIFGGIGAFAVISLLIFIIIRIRNSDFEDWDEDDLDMEPEVEVSGRVSRPLPVGVALDDFESKTIVDDSPDRPDLINEFDEEESYDEYSEEPNESQSQESEEDYEEYEGYEETSEEDSGISVDENGTEWYEDEVGVWWYRDPGDEDWSEYVE